MWGGGLFGWFFNIHIMNISLLNTYKRRDISEDLCYLYAKEGLSCVVITVLIFS